MGQPHEVSEVSLSCLFVCLSVRLSIDSTLAEEDTRY